MTLKLQANNIILTTNQYSSSVPKADYDLIINQITQNQQCVTLDQQEVLCVCDSKYAAFPTILITLGNQLLMLESYWYLEFK